VRFEVLMLLNLKMAVFWDVAPCSLEDTEYDVRVIITVMMEAVRFSQILLIIY
jgi:hypothetical protein